LGGRALRCSCYHEGAFVEIARATAHKTTIDRATAQWNAMVDASKRRNISIERPPASAPLSVQGGASSCDPRCWPAAVADVLAVSDSSTPSSERLFCRFQCACDGLKVVSQQENRGVCSATVVGVGSVRVMLMGVHDIDVNRAQRAF